MTLLAELSQNRADIILGALLSAVVAMSGWTLYTVHRLATRQAANDEKEQAQDATLHEDRARIIENEGKISDLQQRMVRVEDRMGIEH